MATPYTSGPFNIQYGNAVQFVIAFVNASGAVVLPPSASITISYTNLFNFPQTDSIKLTQTTIAPYYVGTWSSTSAALGLATWDATTGLSSIQDSQGQVRIIQRKSS